MRAGARALALAGLALATAAAAAQGQGGPIFKAGDVAPGSFLEQDVDLAAGEVVSWRLVATPSDASASFNIHSHDPDGRAVNHQEGTFTGEREGAFTVPRAATYSWLVENPGTRTLRVTIALERSGAPAASQGTPGFEALALLGAGLGVALAARRP